MPDDLSLLVHLEDLNLSYNEFTSVTSLYNPAKFFLALGTLPRLKKLNLAHNKLKSIHYEQLQTNQVNFDKLVELDMSYNRVDLQENLLYCQNF
jgi:Leucine-rich repeat (LRR) protein